MGEGLNIAAGVNQGIGGETHDVVEGLDIDQEVAPLGNSVLGEVHCHHHMLVAGMVVGCWLIPMQQYCNQARYQTPGCDIAVEVAGLHLKAHRKQGEVVVAGA